MAGIDSFAKAVLHCEGADTSTTFTNSALSGQSFTANGTAQIDTAQFKFDSASFISDGSGSYVSSASHADWAFGTGDFTFDFWVRFTAHTTNNYFVGNSGNGFIFWIQGASNLLHCYNGVSNFISTSWTPSNGVWYHLEWGRSGSINYQFIDGVLQNAGGTSDSTNYAQDNIQLAGINTVNLNGWMDEIRISKGICRHTANFTPETSAYSAAVSVRARMSLMGVGM